MRIDSLKTFDKGNYLSEEESLKLIEKIPIPKDDASSKRANPAETKNYLPGDNPFVDLEGRLIDLNPADNGSNKTQDQWITYFNNRNEIMVSMPDLYLIGKSNNQALLSILQKDFPKNWIITSTRIIYENKDDAKIIHYYGSNVVTPVEYKVIIPEYEDTGLADVLDTKEGLEYLQALFKTYDNKQQIKDTLIKLSNTFLNNIAVWSTKYSNRPTTHVSVSNCVSSTRCLNIYETSLTFAWSSRGMRINTLSTPQTTGGVK